LESTDLVSVYDIKVTATSNLYLRLACALTGGQLLGGHALLFDFGDTAP
jgi:hypothetical protein